MEPRTGYPGGLRLSPRAAAPVKVAPRPTQPRLRLALKDGLKARGTPKGDPNRAPSPEEARNPLLRHVLRPRRQKGGSQE